MAVEIAIPYELVGPDGTRVSFNDSEDPDFVGLIETISGLDSPEVRESADVLVQGDGGIHGAFFYGRRPVVLEGSVWPDPVERRNMMLDRLMRASNAMRADAVLAWTETGGVPRQLFVRRQQPLRVTGGREKKFQLALVSADAKIYAASEQSYTVDALALSDQSGLIMPLTFPFSFTGTGGGPPGGVVVNGGNVSSPPILVIRGPITNPEITNTTTGETIRIDYALPGSQEIQVDVRSHEVILNGTDDIYAAYDFEESEWWELLPGSNDIRVAAYSYSAGASVTVRWRDAWI